MLIEEKMTVRERRKYLSRMRSRYWSAGKKERGWLLDEMEQMTEMHRKSLVRLLRLPDLSRKPRRNQRGRKYGPQVDDAIRVIAESLDYICAERLKPALTGMYLLQTMKRLPVLDVIGKEGGDSVPVATVVVDAQADTNLR